MTAPTIQHMFRPLTADERCRAERFVRKVGELRGSSFAGQPIGLAGELTPGATHAGGQAWGITLKLPSEESLKAVIGDFRQLYTDKNPTSAMSVLKILSQSDATQRP